MRESLISKIKMKRSSILIFIYGAIIIVCLFALFSNIFGEVKADDLFVYLDVGNAPPEVTTTIEENALTFNLTEGTTKILNCTANVTEYNGLDDLENITAVFWNSGSYWNQSNNPDNNYLYKNDSCNWTGGGISGSAQCTFVVEYYANNGTWTCNMTAVDSYNAQGSGADDIDIEPLIALSIPSTMHYGIVDVYNVSSENITNVTNNGNVKIDLSLDGYGSVDGDGLAMNCTSGTVRSIPVYFERYNLTETNTGAMNLTEFEQFYVNLTDSAVTSTEFDLTRRENDTANEAIKSTFWRIYVNEGVAGTCNGTVVFTAVVG